jgi:hypothetical protein
MMSGRAKTTLIYGAIAAAAIGLGLGFLLGIGISGRQELNIAIRDALIIEYELKEAGKLFNETQTVISTALTKATKRQFDQQHLAFLRSNIKGNPMKPTLLTERNYKRFDAAAVQWLVDYFKKWDKLYALIQEHRRSTEYDMKALKASGAAAQKLMETSYGVVFKRDKKLNGAFVANLVVIGAGDGTKFQVQVDTSTFADERTLYNPEGEDSELTKDPEKYLVQLGPESKGGLLANATQSHFKKYAHRLKEISDLMSGMQQNQQDLLDKISAICSQDPANFVDPDPEQSLQDYIQRVSSMAASAE